MKHLILGTLCAFLLSSYINEPKTYRISSPDESVTVEVTHQGIITYSVYAYDTKVLSDCKLGFDVEGSGDLTISSISSTNIQHKKEHITAPFYRQASFDTEYTQLTLRLKTGIDIEVRAYDDGVAYRYVTTGMFSDPRRSAPGCQQRPCRRRCTS